MWCVQRGYFQHIFCPNFLYGFIQILGSIIISSDGDTLAKKYISVITLNTRSQLVNIYLPINISTYILGNCPLTLSIEEIISREDIYYISVANVIK